MNCPQCKKGYYFITKNLGVECECKKCGYLGKFKAPSYENYHQERYSYERVRTINNDPLLKKIIIDLDIKKSDTVLDYGCGAGDYTFQLSQIAKKTVGLDINTKRAEDRFPTIKFIQDNGMGTKYFRSNSIDKIIAINVIEHIHDFEGLLKKLQGILKPNGRLFITTYDTDFILHAVLNDSSHVIEWDKAEFKNLINRFFKVNKAYNYGSFFNYIPFNKLLVKFLKPELCILASPKRQ